MANCCSFVWENTFSQDKDSGGVEFWDKDSGREERDSGGVEFQDWDSGGKDKDSGGLSCRRGIVVG